MAEWQLPVALTVWITHLSQPLHARLAWRLLPILTGMLYVRQKQIALLRCLYGVAFRTKLELAATLVEWLAFWLQCTGQVLWIVADGAYAKRPFLRRALAAGMVVVSRLRKDAALRSLPQPLRRGQPKKRGRKPKYGQAAISLAK